MSKTVLFQTLLFSISTQFSSIWPIDRTLLATTTLGQSGPRSDSNEEVLCISQNSIITGASPSECLVSYPEHSFGEFSISAEMQSVYFTVPANWATGPLLGETYSSAEMHSVYSTATVDSVKNKS